MAAVWTLGCGRTWRTEAGAQCGGRLHGPDKTRDGFRDGEGCCLQCQPVRVGRTSLLFGLGKRLKVSLGFVHSNAMTKARGSGGEPSGTGDSI